MSRKNKKNAKAARERLRARLGNRCAHCGATGGRLDFDCIETRDVRRPDGRLRHHTMDISAQMCFWHRQERDKNLQLLCASCHGKKSAAEAAAKRRLAVAA